MGNYYEMLGQMKDGDFIESEGYPLDIKKSNGSFFYSLDGALQTTWGINGRVVNHTKQEEETWKKIDSYIEIDLNEVANRIREGKDVYVDDNKKLIGSLDDLGGYHIHDFEDAFLYTQYFKKQ